MRRKQWKNAKTVTKKVEQQLASTQYTYYTVVGEDDEFIYILTISDKTEDVRNLLENERSTITRLMKVKDIIDK
ncbi:hypothetical protein [Fervidibacillus albus]|uniref:Uncharacterized protein n=1 Tax=Fervidibacillus albus TaxID=2980026 RepID=A0A9E8LV96_9BACI|nr:hypothetical protein [Fervidibacillus albus]WAA10117.1 hypothetical protein OE104_01880 [Fervidibacillus albus]